ncbi:MAG: short-chain dehydrogenase [Desulfobacterales bacterium CG23_combo_of_CG06-09_8_20_14_all_51_8]|nr:MAG: short-chain dehydrogenase [Desulfobacterales bacterium CG23_combo_of_CG06-09_8_20_14_all_51_8]
MKRFPNKRVVITGAGSGLGRALSIEFAGMGWRIGIADINDAGAKETLKLVEQAGGKGETFHADVTAPNVVKAMADHFFSMWGGVDILVNNAGIAIGGAVGDVPLTQWNTIFDVNFWGMLYGCHEFIPRMKAQGGGHIMNVASAAGLLCLTNMGPYSVTKAAVIALSETLRVEVAPDNIGITAACPMFFNTGLLDDMKSTDPWIVEVARTAFQVGHPADLIAKKLIKAVAKNKLYAVPMFFGKALWWNKRLTPNLYYNLTAWLNRHGWMKPLYLKLARWGVLSK